jgi:hypothetical protein
MVGFGNGGAGIYRARFVQPAGRKREIEALQHRVLNAEAFGPDHPDTKLARNNLAKLQSEVTRKFGGTIPVLAAPARDTSIALESLRDAAGAAVAVPSSQW